MKIRARGFTLVELLIVVMVVAILAAVAVPSYRSYVIRAQRADAKAALLALATAQEKVYLQCNHYAKLLDTATACTADPDTTKVAFGSTSEKGWYDLAVTVATATDFTLTATAKTGAGDQQAKDTQCRIFEVTSTGKRRSMDASNVWKPATSSPCW